MTPINSITNRDYKEIVSTFLYLSDERFNCYACKKSDDRPKILKRIREAKGCYKEDKEPVHSYRRGDIVWHKCPANYMDSGVKHYIKLYQKHEAGFNVFSLPIEKQSSKLVELVDIIDNLFKEFRRKESSKYGKPNS